MFTAFVSAIVSLRSLFRSRASLEVEILALRHQVAVLKRSQRGRVRLTFADRFLWVWLSHFWSRWRSVLLIVRPETVIAWHRRGFRWPLWGAPRIHGELLKLGIEWSQATVAKYMPRQRKPPCQSWRTFLNNHAKQLVSTDFFVVPTISFRVLFVFVILARHRRRVVHFNVTAHPTSEWTTQQLAEAFPWDTAPRYLLHDRDTIYGESVRQRVRDMGIREVLTAPRAPWQNPYVERLVGSIRRECLDHLVVFNERGLRRMLQSYFDYYLRSRTHLALGKDAPESRPIQPSELGPVAELPEVGGLHHRYERRAA